MDSDLDSFVNFDSLDGGKDDVKSSPNFIGSLSPGTAAAAAEAAAAMSSFFSSLPPSTSAPAISPSFMPPQWPSHFPSTTIPQSTDHHLTLPVAWPTHLGDASYDLIDNTAWHHKPHPQHQPSVNATGADTARTSGYVIGETEARGLCGGVPSVDQSLAGADAVPRGFLPSSIPTHRPVELSPRLRHGVGGSVGPQRSSPASSNVGRCQAEGTAQLHADEDAQWMFLGSSISNHGLFDTLPDSTNTPSPVAALVSDSQYNAQQHASTPLFFAAHQSTGYLEHQSPQGARVDVGANFGGISPSQSSFPTAVSSSSERLLYPLAAVEEMTSPYPSSPQNIPSRDQIHQGYDHDTHSANRFGQSGQASSPSYATTQPALGLTESTSNTQTQPVFPIATGTNIPAQVSSVSPPAASFPQFAHVHHAPQVHTDATRPLRRRGLVGWMPNQPQQIQPPSAATRTVSMGATITPPRRAQLVAPTLSAPQPASRTAIAPAAPSGLVVPAEQHADVSTPQQVAPQPHRVALGGFQLKKQTFALQQQAYTFPPRPIPSNPSSSSTGDAGAFVVTRGNKRPRSGSDSSSEVPNALRQHQQDIDVQTIAVRKPRRESKSQRLNLRPDSDSEMGHNDTDGDDEEYKADGDEEDSDDYFPSRSPSPPQASSRRASKSSRGTHSPSVIPLSGAPSLMPSTAPGSAAMYHRFDAGASASTMGRNRSSSSGGTQGSGSGSGKRSKGKARGSAAYALAIVTQRSMQSSSAPNHRDASPNTAGLDAIRISSTSPSSPVFDFSSIDLENHPSIRKRKNHPIPLPVPVPNLNKKSRGRKVPFVLKVDPTGTVEFPEGVTPASSGGALGSPAGDGDEEEVPEPVIPGNEGSKGASRRTPSASGSRRPSSTHVPRKSVTPAPLLSGGEGDRTFVCVIPGCGKCFVRGEHLKRHVRSIHTHDKPHVCPYEGCDKTFSRRDNLGQHVRIHLQQQL